MGILGIFSGPASKNARTSSDVNPTSPDPGQGSPVGTAVVSETSLDSSTPTPAASDVSAVRQSTESTKPPVPRRLSFRNLASTTPKHKPILSEVQEHEKKASAANALAKRLSKPLSSNSDKRAKESALIVRTLIVGPPSNDYATPKLTKAVARPQLSKVKSQLMQPNSANRVIAQLRALPVIDEATANEQDTSKYPSAPIHAVCLAHPDAEEHELHFANFHADSHDGPGKSVPNVASASLDRLTRTFSEMHIVNLLTAPDLGIGQPGDGDGLLAGALPTAQTVLTGIEQITPQLMALGYATGRAILPDHKGVHPPTDRMSVLTYWWGLEVVLPPPTLEYLGHTQSIAGTVVNFLTALSLINNGVREILPFVRYIAQFIDFEFNAIKRQDLGQGVVCASTWIMPAALVPRPWDFPPPEPVNPPSKAKLTESSTSEEPIPGALSPSPSATGPVISPQPDTPLGPPSAPPAQSPPTTLPDTRLSPPPVSPGQSPSAAPIIPIAVPSRMAPPVVLHNSQTVISPGISLT
ncbi:hypothetical protein C8R43DRAFT_871345 [Mycena crocata]|nr:hypothetical protein C8R43DRAFT_871345 [Mycena crocata]